MATNIRGDLKKYRMERNMANNNAIAYQIRNNRKKMSSHEQTKQPKEIFPSTSDIISNLITPYKRTIYFSECDHKATTFIKNLELGKWYYCSECVLFRRISEIMY